MPASQEDAKRAILTLTRNLLRVGSSENDTGFTTQQIREKLQLAISYSAEQYQPADVEEILSELVKVYSRTVGRSSSISNNKNHEDWLVTNRKNNWRYWARYSEYLESNGLPHEAVRALGISTDEILGQIEDPKREGIWDRRGLVVGHVQSGKTSNYTGLICKAADAGYKIIIVLAGLHNNLRSQTQIRLDEGFLGYNTTGGRETIGAGHHDSDLFIRPNAGTNRSEVGDFNRAQARNFLVNPEALPWLFVVKKNKSVLENLHGWVKTLNANSQDKMVTHLPLLIIDDECDQGSVDINEQDFDEFGTADPEHNPTTINGLIRSILHSFSRKAYVGYTATPFANVFIHKSSDNELNGPDLFPSAFITSLGAPSNYIGPRRVFRDSADIKDQALIRPLEPVGNASYTDLENWLPSNHKNGHHPFYQGKDELPPSMQEAIRSFIFACAVRHLRGQEEEHSSMLIHVTRYTSVQDIITTQVSQYQQSLKNRFTTKIDLAETEQLMRDDYLNRFKPGMESIRSTITDAVSMTEFTWGEMLEVIPTVLSDIQIRQINGTAGDALDYEKYSNTGLKVIAIGGDKLSRGLTLEGLCTSYFARTTKMYDTLMQMGRWFGYRDGYLDTCRLYLEPELISWYGHITEAAEELRQDLDLMVASGGTPNDFGLRVRSHSSLIVTSLAKSNHAQKIRVSFAGNLLQTVVFHNELQHIQSNYNAGEVLLDSLHNGMDLNEQHYSAPNTTWSGRLWRGVPSVHIVQFLRSYKTHDSSHRVNSEYIAHFIESMARESIKRQAEYDNWTVALVGRSNSETSTQIHYAGNSVVCLKRSHNNPYDSDRYSIKTLISPRDEAIDLTESQWKAALECTIKAWKPDVEKQDGQTPPSVPSGPAIRKILGEGWKDVQPDRNRGLLILYLLDQQHAATINPESDKPVLAWAISLPNSDRGSAITDDTYMVNTVELETHGGSSSRDEPPGDKQHAA